MRDYELRNRIDECERNRCGCEEQLRHEMRRRQDEHRREREEEERLEQIASERRAEARRQAEEYWAEQECPTGSPCDICGTGEAVAGSNGYGVCSEECANEAAGRMPPPPK